MIKKAIALGCLGAASGIAVAQSSVTLYGLVDASITHVDNVAGGSTLTMDNGAWQSSRIGFRGTEDLGGGLSALFTLEAGVNVDTGATSSVFFGRQSFVGLSSAWGSFTFGRQYDFVYYLADGRLVAGGLESAVAGGPGGTAGAVTPLDLHAGGVRYDNSAKWVHRFGPVGVGLMYGLGQEKTVPGDTDRMMSATVTYKAGGLDLGLAWVKDNYNAANSGNNANQVVTLKGTYQAGPWITFANATTGKSRNSRARHTPYEIGFMYSVTPAWAAGLAVSHANVTNAVGRSTHSNRLLLGTTYDLSKRSLVYAVAGFSKSGDSIVYRAHVGAPGGASAPSSDDSQRSLRIGVRHTF